MEKFKDRKEQREVIETMDSLLLPMLNYLNPDTTIKVKKGLYLLREIEIESSEIMKHETCKDCVKALCYDLRICQKSIKDKKVLIGFNMAVSLCNKHLIESEE